MPGTIIMLVILVPIMGLFIFMSTKVVQEGKAIVVERLGVYNKTLYAGVFIVVPFVDRVIKEVNVSVRDYRTNDETFKTFDDQSLTLRVKIVFQVTDPKLYHYGFDKDMYKVQEVAFDSTRNLILKNTLENVKLELNSLNTELQTIIEEQAQAWGISIKKVQIVV